MVMLEENPKSPNQNTVSTENLQQDIKGNDLRWFPFNLTELKLSSKEEQAKM